MKFRIPFLTLTVAALAVAVHLLPGNVATALQFDRHALELGEWWRIVTAHLAHFGANHLAWDVGMLVVLGWACERESRPRAAFAVGLASVAIPIAVWFWQPQFETYRGLSGLDCALFGLFAASLIHHHQRTPKLIGALALLAVCGKCAVEIASGSTVFANGIGYAPVPLAHLVGVVSGVLSAVQRDRLRDFGVGRNAHVCSPVNPN